MRKLNSYISKSRKTRTGLFLASTLISSFLLLGNADAAEDYYTWIDENGVTNYAERNPQGYDARYVSRERKFGRRAVNRQAATQTASIPDSPLGNSGVDPDEAIAEQRKIVAAEQATIKKSNCEIGKKNLVRLEMFSRIRVTDDNGQSRTLTSDEKNTKEAEARKVIRENCSG